MVNLDFEDQELEDIFNALESNDSDIRTTVSDLITLTDELHDDHATNETAMSSVGVLVTEIQTEYDKMVTDVGAIHTAVTAITAKLDADAGVTDTDYASTCDPAATTAVATTNPAPTAGAPTLTATKATALPALNTTTGT